MEKLHKLHEESLVLTLHYRSEPKLKPRNLGVYINKVYQHSSGRAIEIDRIIPGKEGGKYTYGNTQLLHRHCHDNKTREDAHKYLVGTKELEEYFDENPF